MAGNNELVEKSEEKAKARLKFGDYFRVLYVYPAYRLVLFSYFVDTLGNWFTFISCLAISDTFGVMWTTIYLMIRLLPSFVFAPCLGPFADKLDKRLGMIGCSLASAVIILMMAVIVGDGSSLSYFHLYALYFASIVQFTLDTLYGPLRGSLIPLLVDKNDLMVTATWDGFGWSTISAFGASIGGFVTSKYGYRAAFLLDAVTFIVCACMIYLIPTVTIPQVEILQIEKDGEKAGEKDGEMEERRRERISGGGEAVAVEEEEELTSAIDSQQLTEVHSRNDLKSTDSYSMNKEMISYLSANPFILLILFLRGSGSLIWGAADLLTVRFSDLPNIQHYGDKDFTLGIIFATVGVGCQVGPMFWNAITPQEEYSLFRVNVISFGQIALSYFIMMSTTHINHLLIATFIRSFASGIMYIYGGLIIQILVPSFIQGRVLTYERGIYTMSKLLSTLMTGVGFDYMQWNEYQMSLFMALFSGIVTIIWGGIFISHYHTSFTNSLFDWTWAWTWTCPWRWSGVVVYEQISREDEEENENERENENEGDIELKNKTTLKTSSVAALGVVQEV